MCIKKEALFYLVVMDLLQALAFNNRLVPIQFSPAPTRMPAICDIIKGQANHVMRCLGKGHTESVYHRALITAMNKAGVAHRSEVSCPIWFMGECIGCGKADLVIDNVVVEIKANKQSPKETSAQLKKYLVSLTHAEKKTFYGLVVNFNQKNGNVDLYHEPTGDGQTSEIFERSTKKIHESRKETPMMFKRKSVAFFEVPLERLKRGRKY
jgi:GxxExxY protein